ncbi:FAD-binding oxidoreductase [Bacillus cereus]|uniref:FAD-binding oxidoreductase n=1 Tax=Bacillus thuringiensis TaxID=1428 RepID=A0A9X6WJP9_BACTU|nr:FAD-binding oxidoreductase [Bacillus thuringiensis]PFJ33183.1 FAD-binding oxidoreductase [Bacillus thuringiensis]
MKKSRSIPLLLGYSILFGFSIHAYQKQISHHKVEDAGRLLPVSIKRIESSTNEKEIQEIVKQANKTGDKLSIAGMQHSQGGHTYYPNGIMIDMKSYNKILDFNPKEKTITVQSGVTWNDIQRKINPYGLAIKVMQSQNIFTVGGSLSANVHGRDIRNDALIDTVKSMRLLKPDGTIVTISKNQNPELFSLVMGGYGLFGVILDVTFELTDDELYKVRTDTIDYQEYTSYFKKEILENPNAKMHMARISVAPDTFLKKMYVIDYLRAPSQEKIAEYNTLIEDNIIAAPKFFMGLSRYSDWGKNMFWDVQKKYIEKINGSYETRNNVMRSSTAFMEYESSDKTEILQEYFVPIDNFNPYINDLRKVLEKEDLNLINITVRYVEKNDHAVLSYAKDDMFALVILINQGRSTEDINKTKTVIQKLIDVSLKYNGSYYLPYYPYPTKKQIDEAYPRIDEFFEKKRKYDPNERFMNLFYKEYGL